MVTIDEIGVDQIIVDEAQEFRKLTFATNQATLKGVDPDGSQRAWDLYVKARFLDAKRNPGRALIAASGTPITNTLGEMYTLLRFFQPEALAERGVHEFDAWAAAFGETTTELELQPSGLYKPVTRFAEFINVPDLMVMFRDCRGRRAEGGPARYLTLPDDRAAASARSSPHPASPAFKAYQKASGASGSRRSKQRQRKAAEGRRHPALGHHRRPACRDRPAASSTPSNRERAGEQAQQADRQRLHKSGARRAIDRYLRPDGAPYSDARRRADDLLRPRHASVEKRRGFSAYRWIKRETHRARRARGRDRLHAGLQEVGRQAAAVRRLQRRQGADPDRLVRDHGHRRQRPAAARRRCTISTCRGCRPRSSSARAGSSGRATSTTRSRSSPMRPSAASTRPCGRTTSARRGSSTRRCPATARSAGSRMSAAQANQFAMAKAIASGDERLMQKAGLESEIARLERQRDSHFDDQLAIRRQIDRLGRDADEARAADRSRSRPTSPGGSRREATRSR